MLLRIFLRR